MVNLLPSLLPAVLCNQELLEPHRLRGGGTLPPGKRLLDDRRPHGQPLPQGETTPTCHLVHVRVSPGCGLTLSTEYVFVVYSCSSSSACPLIKATILVVFVLPGEAEV